MDRKVTRLDPKDTVYDEITGRFFPRPKQRDEYPWIVQSECGEFGISVHKTYEGAQRAARRASLNGWLGCTVAYFGLSNGDDNPPGRAA